MRALHRPLLALLVPEGILLLAALAFLRHAPAWDGSALFLRVFPWAVLAAGLTLGWRFHRTRLLFGLAVLALGLTGLHLVRTVLTDAAARAVAVQTIALLVPANMIALAIIRERGFFTRTGLARLATIAAQAGLVALIAETAREDALRLLSIAPIPERILGTTQIGQLAALLFLVAAGVLLARALLTRDPLTRSLLWATVATYVGMLAHPDSSITTFHFSTAGLMLVVGTMEGAHAMAFRDELTGLPARRALMEHLARITAPYTVAMVDIDHFKQVNDRHGHDVGDQVLRMVAGRLGRVGGGGKAFRYGGEEFAIVFAATHLDDAVPALEAVREAIEDAPFTLRGPGRPRRKPKKPKARGASQRLRVTVSIGAAQCTNGEAEAGETIQAADRALYRAKDGGRNRIAR